MVSRSCDVCRATYETQYPTRKKTCSTRCRQYLRKHPGFVDPENIECSFCGTRFQCSPEGKRNTKYCSSSCRGAASKRRAKLVKNIEFRTSRLCQFCGTVIPEEKIHRALYCSAQCQMWSESRYSYEERMAIRTCRRCGAEFQASSGGRVDRLFCSERCQRYYNARLRDERQQAAIQSGDVFTDLDILRRDNWICHVCHKDIDPLVTERDPLMGTVDHLIALALPASPGHVLWNVAAAHLTCNQSRQSRTRDVDFELVKKLRLRYELEGGW